MHLTIERAQLLSVLSHVHSVVEKRHTVPILSNVLIEAQGQTLTFTATDMDLTVEERAAANISQDGATTLSAHMLYDIVRKLADGSQVEMRLDPENEQCHIAAGRSSFELPTLPRDGFPSIRNDDMPEPLGVAGPDLKQLIERTRFAISTEETRYYLNGIYLESFEQDGTTGLRAVATDGHRLAKCEIAMDLHGLTLPGVIVPRKTVGEIYKIVEGEDEALELSVSETKIRLKRGDMTLTSKLIDGNFPDYQRVIPANNEKLLSCDPKALAKAVDRVSVVSTDRSRGVKFGLDAGAMSLQSNSAGIGSAFEELEVSYNADPLTVGFNARYLSDILGQLGGEVAHFRLNDSASPVVVSDPEDQTSLFVLMPMRV